MDGVSSDAATAGGGKGHSQAGRRSCADSEVWVPEVLGRKRVEGDGLAGLGNRESLRYIGSRIVVSVSNLRSSNRAGACAGEMDGGTSYGAIAASGKGDRQAGRCGCADSEVRITKVLA